MTVDQWTKRGVLFLLLLVACRLSLVWAQEQQPPPGITGGGPAEEAEKSEEPEKEEAPVETPKAPATQQERLQTKVNLSFTGAPLKNVLSSLAKVYGLNIVAPEDVTGTVTLTLRGVTLEEGLRQILKLNGWIFTVRGGIVEVSKLEEKKVNELIPLKYLDADTALEFVKPWASEDAVIKPDEATNAILVSDFMNKIGDIKAALARVDQPPQQVLIESKIMDITHTDLDNLGLSFSSVSFVIPMSSGSLPLAFSSGSLTLAGPTSDLTGDDVTFTVAQGSETASVTLDAMIRDRKVKVIATPTILTLNNVEAKITIGEKFPIREQTQTSTGTLETTRFVDVGTTLRVTPKINLDGFIQMHIHPEVSSVSSTLDAGPRITTREADTTVIVKDGQPIVIAGLIQEDETLIKDRIPLVGHLPLIGLLFQSRGKDSERKELVIVITPHLVGAEQPTSGAEVQEAAVRLDASEFFQRGLAIERGVTLQARQMPEVLRSRHAMALYQKVVDRYPDHPYAMESLWRMGAIARESLNDLHLAEAVYQRLITQFPEGKYRRRAEWHLEAIQKQRQRQGQERVTAKAPPPRRENFRPR